MQQNPILTTPTQSLRTDLALDAVVDSSTDPLVVELKGSERLAKLKLDLMVQTTTLFKTSPVSRVMRRDWNIVTVKMFFNTMDPRMMARIRDDLTELQWQAADLLDSLKSIPMSKVEPMWMRPRSIEVQVISPLAGQLLRTMKIIDQCYLIMINAEKAEIITRKRRWAMMAPVQLAYLGFKTAAMNLPLKSTTELLESAQVV